MRKLDSGNFRRLTRGSPREVNRRIVLALVHEHQPISRADVARRMSTSRGMVTELVNELLAADMIYEGALGTSMRGRRPTYLYIRTAGRLVMSVDVRRTRTWVGLGDFSGSLAAIDSFPTVDDPAVLSDLIAERTAQLWREHGHAGPCEGLGIVVPGMVDRHTNRVLRAPQLGWRDVDLLPLIADKTGLRCAIENAPIACALAHIWFGGPELRRDGESSFVYVTVSDGVGSAIVFDGNVLRGAVGTAGEFGHVPLSSDGPLCSCGAYGCFEAFVSNIATRRRYLALTGAANDELMSADTVPIDSIIERAGRGELAALTALRETGNYLGLGLAMIVNAVNPAEIIVGGEISGAWPVIEDAIRDALDSRGLTLAATSTPIRPDRTPMPRLRGAMALIAAPHWAIPEMG